MSADDEEALERELDVILAKSGVVLPSQWRSGVIAGYRDLQRMTLLLRQPRTAASEPSNIYRLSLNNRQHEPS